MQTKICTKCDKEKPLNDFYKQKLGKFGVTSVCKICTNIAHAEYGALETTKARRKEYHSTYDHKKSRKKYQNSEYGKATQKKYRLEHPWVVIFSSINTRCKNKNAPKYFRYGGRGIKNLFKNSYEIKFLWFRDKAYLMKRPSIHRIDNDDNYCTENCIFLEVSDHTRLHKMKKNSKIF